MEDARRARIEVRRALLRAHISLQLVQLQVVHRIHRRRHGRRARRCWTRPWLSVTRRRAFGLYDQLMVELRNEDPESFTNFMRMPPAMFDEILQRVGPRIEKQHTSFREPIEPGLKLAVTLRHLASGSKYTHMRFGWRVAHNSISLVVREVSKYIYIVSFRSASVGICVTM